MKPKRKSVHSERDMLHQSSRVGCFRTWVERWGSGGVGCEGSAASFMVDVAGRSGITNTELEPSVYADFGAVTSGAGTGVDAVGAGDGCSSGV